MAQNTVNVRLVTLSDTKENWELNNPVLLKGEQGIEFDGDITRLKIGDGTSTWADLPYTGGSASTSGDFTFYDVEPQEEESDLDAITRVVGGAQLKDGDNAVVRHLIDADKYSYTAYVYDAGAWKAMDGNYSADNVYFDSDLTATAAIGVVTIPSSGSKTISAKGKTLRQVLDSILAEEKNPTITQPSISISMPQAGQYEVGTQLTPSYTITVNPGNYQYGPATGVTATSYSVTDGTNTQTTQSGTMPQLTVSDGTNYRLSATAQLTAGAIPVTNLDNEYAQGQIQAGSKSANSGYITGYRSFFYGIVASSSSEAPLNSALIRSLTNGGRYSAKTLPTIAASSVSGAKRVIVAVPANHTGVTKVTMPSAMNADATASFVLQGDQVQVNGVNNAAAAAYKVWVYEPAQLDQSETYSIVLG